MVIGSETNMITRTKDKNNLEVNKSLQNKYPLMMKINGKKLRDEFPKSMSLYDLVQNMITQTWIEKELGNNSMLITIKLYL